MINIDFELETVDTMVIPNPCSSFDDIVMALLYILPGDNS